MSASLHALGSAFREDRLALRGQDGARGAEGESRAVGGPWAVACF